ncbi:MAG: hypothetical protein ACKVW3_05275, partial [Phycisphaerales bacterium]
MAAVIATLAPQTVMAQQVGEIKFWGTPIPDPLPQGGFVQVETGWRHWVGLRPDGTVECGTVGEPFGCANAPGLHEKFVYIVAGYYHNFGIRADGTLRAWGTSITGDEATVPADLERFHLSRSEYPQCLKQLAASEGVTAASTDRMAFQSASLVRQ